MRGTRNISLRGSLIAGICATLLFAMVVAIRTRGPWYDEFYTYYITRPGTGLAQGWPIWLNDNHPPLFYFLAWSMNWLGDELAQGRLVNLAFFPAAVLAIVLTARNSPASRQYLFYYALALASYTQTIAFASELRSYFLSLCAGAAVVFALATLPAPFAGRPSSRATALLIIVLAVGFYIHFVTTVILSSLAVVFWIRYLLFRDWQNARWLAAVGALSALPFVATLAFQYSTLVNNTKSFWISSGFTAARWAIDDAIKTNLLANPLLTLAGGTGVLLLLWKDWRARRLGESGMLVITLGAGMALALTVLIGLHLRHPIVTSRYLVSLHPPVAFVMAIGLVELSRRAGQARRAILDVVLAAATVIAILANLRHVSAEASWDGTSAAIAQIVSRCPSAIVHVDRHWNAKVMDMPPVQNREVFPFAYGWQAARFGFKVEPEGSLKLSNECPTIFWTEHGVTYEPPASEILANLRAEGFAVRAGLLRPIGWGWIFVVEPEPRS